MPWDFQPNQIYKIAGRNGPAPNEIRQILNGAPQHLVDFFQEKRATTILVNSGNRLQERLNALANVVTAMNQVANRHHKFSASNISSMLGNTWGGFVTVTTSIVSLVTPPDQNQLSPLAAFGQAGLTPRNISSMLHNAGSHFQNVADGLRNLTMAPEGGGPSTLQALGAAGLQPKNFSSILSSAATNFGTVVNGLRDLIAMPPGGGQSTLQALRAAELTPDNIASMLSGVRGNFNTIVTGLRDLTTPVSSNALPPWLGHCRTRTYRRCSNLITPVCQQATSSAS